MKGLSHSILILFGLLIFTACFSSNVVENNNEKIGTEKNIFSPDNKDEEETNEPFKISIMLTSYTQKPMDHNSPVWKAIELYTNSTLDILWVPNSVYEDKLDITLASGDLPTLLLVPSKTASVINAARNGAFWDLSPYINDYSNLSQANPVVLKNTSIDGKIYGIYRSRKIGRNGISFRSDWLDNVGMKEPETIDDFYEMLKAFTYNDPDGNGMDDTYGMMITKWNGPWDIMQTWFGAPNKWKIENGQIIADFMTEEYMDALRFFKRIYEEGLINKGFALVESSKWVEPYMEEKAGVIVDVLDFSTTLQSRFENKQGYKTIIWDVVGSVEGPKGRFNLPFSGGYNGMFVITKNGAKTETDLKRVLEFLNQMNDYEMQVLIMYGVLDTHYIMDEDGYYEVVEDVELFKDYTDAAQLGMAIQGDFRYDLSMPIQRDALTIKRNQVFEDNVSILVENPCEAFISDTYAKKGSQLDQLILDARVQFIVGLIDEEEFGRIIDEWRVQGGDDIIAEYTQAYNRLGME